MTRPEPGQPEPESDGAVVRLNVEMPASVEGITPVVEQILAIARSIDCGDGNEFEIETALREALANAIVHGCNGDPCKQVRVTVACTHERSIIIVVSDPGNGFDPDQLPSPLEGENLMSNHGRGIFLIDRLMDEVRIERGGSRIWMRKDAPKGSEG